MRTSQPVRVVLFIAFVIIAGLLFANVFKFQDIVGDMMLSDEHMMMEEM